MVVELSVENLAIIDRAHIELGPGFTALTGETGAGKSLLIDAINLALGERADAELVRTGAAKATVQAVFELPPELQAKIEALGVPLEGNRLFVNREVAAKGGSQCRLGGKLAPVATLRQVGQWLVDLHGQHDHQSLLDPERHIGFLDDWIGAPATEALRTVEEAFRTADEARLRLDRVRRGMRDREHRLDLLKFQVNEIEAANPQPNETEELEATLNRLRHAEKLANAAFGALGLLSDGEVPAIDSLASAGKGIEAVVRFDDQLEPLADRLRAARIEVEEVAFALRDYSESLDADPQRLDDVQARLDTLRRLRRKYGATEQEILDFLAESKRELDVLVGDEVSEDDLAAQHDAARAQHETACERLSTLRRERATEFAILVQRELRDLAMERAQFAVHFGRRPADATGFDQVEFHFSANAGEPARPLSKIASGGEISRVMLAIKSAMAGRAGVPTLIFDEVDVGLGGRAAAVMARKLEELARHYQVIVISHLPQIASRATAHFRIEKGEQEGRVTTRVVRLDGDQRVHEIARMLAGEHITPSAIANARELLGL